MEGVYQVDFLGRKRDVFFGMPAIEYVFRKVDFTVVENISKGAFEVKDMKTIVHFVYAALMGGCERLDETPDFTYGDVYSAIDKGFKTGEFGDIFTIVGKAFSDGLPEKMKKGKSKKKDSSTAKAQGK